MAMKFTTTDKTTTHVKCLVYGDADAGKTWLCQTAPKPVIISVEGGLMTLQDLKIPVIEISTLADLKNACEFVSNDSRAANFETICLDSISDIAEAVLGEEKLNNELDPRQAYMTAADKLLPILKKFRDIPGKNIYFTAKLRRMTDEFTGITTFGPSMPGQQLGSQLAYLFDFCLALRKGQAEDGKMFRYLQTTSNIQYVAKARGGRLNAVEPPDLGALFKKALSAELPEKKSDKATTLTDTANAGLNSGGKPDLKIVSGSKTDKESDESFSTDISENKAELELDQEPDGSFSTDIDSGGADESEDQSLEADAENFLLQDSD